MASVVVVPSGATKMKRGWMTPPCQLAGVTGS